MAWDANEKGNYAYLTKTANEHGGVDNFIDDIHNEGYQEGREHGMIEGAGATTVVIAAAIGAYEVIRYLVQKHKAKKQAIVERSEAAQEAIRQICSDSNGELYDESEKTEIDDE